MPALVRVTSPVPNNPGNPLRLVLSWLAAHGLLFHSFLPHWVVGFFSSGTGPDPLEFRHVFILSLSPYTLVGRHPESRVCDVPLRPQRRVRERPCPGVSVLRHWNHVCKTRQRFLQGSECCPHGASLSPTGQGRCSAPRCSSQRAV